MQPKIKDLTKKDIFDAYSKLDDGDKDIVNRKIEVIRKRQNELDPTTVFGWTDAIEVLAKLGCWMEMQ